jgi:hypothetical protein
VVPVRRSVHAMIMANMFALEAMVRGLELALGTSGRDGFLSCVRL